MIARVVTSTDLLPTRRRRAVPEVCLRALEAAPVTMGAKWTYIALYRLGHYNRLEWPTQKQLAAILGCSKDRLQAAQKELQQVGALRIVRGKGGRENWYGFPAPPWILAEA